MNCKNSTGKRPVLGAVNTNGIFSFRSCVVVTAHLFQHLKATIEIVWPG